MTYQGTNTANAGTSLYVGYYATVVVTNAAGGSITATGAGAIAYLQNIINLGTLYAQVNGVLNFQGTTNTTAHLGSISLSGGGRALIGGTIDNTAATLNAPGGGVFELYGGTVNNGTIAAGALSFTSSGGTLSNVSYTGDLTLPASTTVTFTNNTLFTGPNATLGNSITPNWNQNGTSWVITITSGTTPRELRVSGQRCSVIRSPSTAPPRLTANVLSLQRQCRWYDHQSGRYQPELRYRMCLCTHAD